MFSASQMKKADKDEGQKQRHFARGVVGGEGDGGAGVEAEGEGGEVPAVVADVVVGEKVEVNQQGTQGSQPVGRMAADAQVKQRQAWMM